MANYWYDPRHRDLYLEYSLYLAVIDNIKNQDTSTTINSSSNDSSVITEVTNVTLKDVETHISSVIAAVAAVTLKVAESHNVNNDVRNVTLATTIDEILDRAINVHGYNLCKDDNDGGISDAKIRKLGLTRLKYLVLIGGPNDEVISPWQSR